MLLRAAALALALLPGCAPVCDSDRDPPLDFENFGEGFLADYCMGCHSALLTGSARHDAPVGVDFNTYGDVMRHAERIEARSTGPEPTMPPSGGPSELERARLQEWLTCSVLPDAAAVEE